MANWDIYSRHAVDLALSASSIGFSAAKSGTRLGFSIARRITSTTVGLTTAAVDHTLFGGSTVTRPVIGAAVTSVLTLAEQITLAPIHLSEYITSTSLLAAHGSINVLSGIFPGSSDASFSLVSVIALVRRELNYPGEAKISPDKHYSLAQIARAIVAWVALQGATQEWQEKKWLQHLREIDVIDPRVAPRIKRQASRIRVTSDIIFPGHQGPQIIAADIGDPDTTKHRPFMSRTKSHISLVRSRASSNAPLPIPMTPPPLPNDELKTTMRRLSKLVLAGYGGATLLFFGLSPESFGRAGANSSSRTKKTPTDILTSSDSIAREKTEEEAKLTCAVDAAEAEAANDGETPDGSSCPAQNGYSWWDLLLGKHDHEIFERTAAHPGDAKLEKAAKKKADLAAMKATAVVGDEHMMPRFWVITDHSRGQIVLVIRGTMSLNEIAVDLTCDVVDFEPASTPAPTDLSEIPIPGQFEFPTTEEHEKESNHHSHRPRYQVHGGMLRLAKLMGDVGKPVQVAVKRALYNNPDFDLLLCGHSLGAGVAGMLGMMWADPKTCLTVRSSGLPVGRSVQVFAFGPPTITDAPLARFTDKLIVSLVYSHDIVSRLSLGTVRDLKNAAMWLCDAEEKGGVEGWSAVTARAKRWQAGHGTPDDLNWLIAVRKTLEANMQQTHMYPPGRVLWAMRDADLHPAHRLHHISSYGVPQSEKDANEKLRVFEVLDVEKVFSQLVFARDMLTAHFPHQYDRVIHDLL